MARYLITGIAGFIGSTLAHTLAEQGHDVRGIDNLSTGSLDNLAGIRDKISFQQVDLQDAAAMRSASQSDLLRFTRCSERGSFSAKEKFGEVMCAMPSVARYCAKRRASL